MVWICRTWTCQCRRAQGCAEADHLSVRSVNLKCEVPFRVKIVVVIQDPEEIRKILKHLIKVGRAPPNFNPSTLN